MAENLTINIFNFIKEKEIITIEELKKKFKDLDSKTLSYHLNKTLKLGIKKIKKGLYTYEIISNQYLLYMKLNEGNILSYHTAFEFYGLGHTEFYTIYIQNKQKLRNLKDIENKEIKYIQPKINHYHNIIRKGITYKVTTLEQTFIECLLNLKYCGGFEEFYNCIQGIKEFNQISLKNNGIPEYEEINQINLNYLLKLLKKYNIKKLYNLTGFVLDNLLEHFGGNIPESFFEKLKTHMSKKKIMLEKTSSKEKIISDETWKINYSTNLELILEGMY